MGCCSEGGAEPKSKVFKTKSSELDWDNSVQNELPFWAQQGEAKISVCNPFLLNTEEASWVSSDIQWRCPPIHFPEQQCNHFQKDQIQYFTALCLGHILMSFAREWESIGLAKFICVDLKNTVEWRADTKLHTQNSVCRTVSFPVFSLIYLSYLTIWFQNERALNFQHKDASWLAGPKGKPQNSLQEQQIMPELTGTNKLKYTLKVRADWRIPEKGTFVSLSLGYDAKHTVHLKKLKEIIIIKEKSYVNVQMELK